jgi:polyferredoxin
MALATAGGTQPIDPARVRTAEGKLAATLRHISLVSFLRPRTLLYAALWSLVGAGLVYALVTRDRLDVNVLHDRNPQFVMLSDGSVRNGYTLKILNMIAKPRVMAVRIVGLPPSSLAITGMEAQGDGSFLVPVEPDRLRSLKVFVTQPRHAADAQLQTVQFVIEDTGGPEKNTYTATFQTPGGSK